MKLRIVVAVKAVVLEPPGSHVDRSADLLHMNPFDRCALETALRLREKRGGSVTALSMGPKTARIVLKEALAMGADESILVCDPLLAGSDTLATSTALAAAIRALATFDMILFGLRAADSDTGQVPSQTAAALDIPFVSKANSFAWTGDGLEVERSADGFLDRFRVRLPAAFSVDPDAATPRPLPLAGIEKAFASGLERVMDSHDLGLGPEDIGLAGSGTEVASMVQSFRNSVGSSQHVEIIQHICNFISHSLTKRRSFHSKKVAFDRVFAGFIEI